MTDYVGGIRSRLIRDNFRRMIEESLTELDWMNPNRKHLPVTVKSGPFDPDQEIKPNVVGISIENVDSEELEMGSILEETRHYAYIDIYAQDDPIGTQLSGDVFDIIRGKFNALAVSEIANGRLNVLDLTNSGQASLFWCELENYEISRVRTWTKNLNKFWWVIAVEIVDAYTDDEAG
jgi:hypothetical protein